jgi:hypothetical protein
MKLPDAARRRLYDDLRGAKAARGAGDRERVWALLEEAHILSQPAAWWHVRVHAAMLAEAWRERDAFEFRGQVLRLVVAGPGSLTGRYPVGNSGRAAVPATMPMPIPAELADLLGIS